MQIRPALRRILGTAFQAIHDKLTSPYSDYSEAGFQAYLYDRDNGLDTGPFPLSIDLKTKTGRQLNKLAIASLGLLRADKTVIDHHRV